MPAGAAVKDNAYKMEKRTKAVVEKPRRKRGEKKAKDSNRPKRPTTAFMLWLNETREKIKADQPGIRVTEIAKKGGEMWRNLKDKSEWEEKAAKSKEDYAKAMKEYEASGGGQDEDAFSKPAAAASKKPAAKKPSAAATGRSAAAKGKDSSSSGGEDEEDDVFVAKDAKGKKKAAAAKRAASDSEPSDKENGRPKKKQKKAASDASASGSGSASEGGGTDSE